MSEEMARKKREEEELLRNLEEEDQKMIRHDICPHCGTHVTDFNYMNVLPPPYLWIECPACGIIFCPASIRTMKNNQASQVIKPASIVLASK